MIRQYEIGERVRVRPVLYLPATPETTYRVRARHTYPATVTETFHHPVGTFIRVILDEHKNLVMSDAHREMLVAPVDVHHWKCDCRRCTKRPTSRGLDYAKARFRRWASVAWAKWENLFDY